MLDDAQVDVPGLGPLCRHALAYSSQKLWCVGGFDSQKTLSETLCIDIESLGQLKASSHSTNPKTFSQSLKPTTDQKDSSDIQTKVKETPSQDALAQPSSGSSEEAKQQVLSRPTVTSDFSQKSVPDQENPGNSMSLAVAYSGSREDGTASRDLSIEASTSDTEASEGWRSFLPQVAKAFWRSQAGTENVNTAKEGQAVLSTGPDFPAFQSAVQRSNSIEDMGQQVEGNKPECRKALGGEFDTSNEAALALPGSDIVNSSAIMGDAPQQSINHSCRTDATAVDSDTLLELIEGLKSGEISRKQSVTLDSKHIACSIAQGAPLNFPGEIQTMSISPMQTLPSPSESRDGQQDAEPLFRRLTAVMRIQSGMLVNDKTTTAMLTMGWPILLTCDRKEKQ